jgi:hypothetical protein
MAECFIVDWPVAVDTTTASGSIVEVKMHGRQAGLYRVKQIMQEGMLLSQGAISFPVGTQLDVGYPQSDNPGTRFSGCVVANDHHGLRVAWSLAA